MSLKSTDLISNIESVSKTKIRGVLALLKHGELLTTQGNEYSSVWLFYIHCHYYHLIIMFWVKMYNVLLKEFFTILSFCKNLFYTLSINIQHYI